MWKSGLGRSTQFDGNQDPLHQIIRRQIKGKECA